MLNAEGAGRLYSALSLSITNQQSTSAFSIQHSNFSISSAPPSPSTPAAARKWGDHAGVFVRRAMARLLRLGQQAAPVSDGIGTIPVNLEPGDGLGQHRPMQQRPLCSGWGLCVEQSRLERENLLQALDVPPRNRQHPQLDSSFERVG
jgi:hypothetical protein